QPNVLRKQNLKVTVAPDRRRPPPGKGRDTQPHQPFPDSGNGQRSVPYSHASGKGANRHRETTFANVGPVQRAHAQRCPPTAESPSNHHARDSRLAEVGMETRNTVFPGTDSTSIRPPCSSVTIRQAMSSPSPVPSPCGFVV